MKGDFSRPTFDPARHYAGVRMQQGRVQLDADWNEQGDITRHRTETETRDAVGRCGGPLHASGFGVVKLAALAPAQKAYVQARWPGFAESGGNFLLSAGRYYVDGLLVENEHAVPYALQPDLPGVQPLAASGNYLLYLDVWERHLTALEEPSLREIALGGPDTATRARVLWQVRALGVGQGTCAPVPAAYTQATAPSTGRLRMRARADASATDPCVVPAGAGYRGLENQLYRVEIHDPGAPVSHAAVPGWDVASAVVADRKLTLAVAPGNITGKAVELYHATAADPSVGTVAYVTAVAGKEVTLSGTFKPLDAAAAPRLRLLNATAKWSRDNGVVLARVRSISGVEVVVESFGVDDVLSIHGGDWVEIFDDTHELKGEPGRLYQVASRNDATRTLVLRVPAATLGGVGGVDPSRNPRVRRWDGLVAVKTALPGQGYAELESGVQLRWEGAADGGAGAFRTGDWWNAAARTATAESLSGTLEWPLGLDGEPEVRGAAGIVHHYCRLGIVQSDAGVVKLLDDCRCFFAPATEVNSLAYVSGAGQEAMPDLANPSQRVELGLPLVVGVPNAHCREQPASVRFTIVQGGGSLSAAAGTASNLATLDVPLGPDGLARAWWWMGTANLAAAATLNQLAQARLLENGVPVQLPVLFNASLSMANRVSYDPGLCDGLKAQFTVQKAIDRLAHAASLYPASGDGGEVMPGTPTTRKLRVMLASECGPISTKDAVMWRVVPGMGAGKLNGSPGTVKTTPVNGFAEVTWALDPTTHYQEVEAFINPQAGLHLAEPTRVFFSATLSTADQVEYTPGDKCGADMKAAGIDTVEKALNWFCEHQGHGGGCSVTVGEGGDYPTLAAALAQLGEVAAVNICLLPGIHQVTSRITLDRPFGTVRITGSGAASLVAVMNKGGFTVKTLAGFTMRDVMMLSAADTVLEFDGCADVVLEHCLIGQESRAKPMITVAGAGTVRVAGCVLYAEKPPAPGAAVKVTTKLNAAFVGRMRQVRTATSEATIAILAPDVVKLATGRATGRGGGGGGGVHAMADLSLSLPTGAGEIKPPPFGDVLALLDTTAANYLEDNVCFGYVRLYGTGTPLSLTNLKMLLTELRKSLLPEHGGSLFMRGNLLWAVRLDGTATQVVGPKGGPAPRVPFRSCTLTDNSFWDSFSQVLAVHHTVGGNQWAHTALGDLLVIGGRSATLTGNSAAHMEGVRVFVAVPGGRIAEAANLLQVIAMW
jgi:hypothetical protein